MKLKIKELNFDSGKFDFNCWKLVAAILVITLFTFKNEILAILRSLRK
jgi:hypothetical protein